MVSEAPGSVPCRSSPLGVPPAAPLEQVLRSFLHTALLLCTLNGSPQHHGLGGHAFFAIVFMAVCPAMNKLRDFGRLVGILL